MLNKLRVRWARLREWWSGFMFGAAMSWVMAPHTVQRRHELEGIFILMTAADLMGFSLVPPMSSQRLLPFLVPQILYWRRRLALWDEELESVDLKHLGH
jgi:hypothetical protein